MPYIKQDALKEFDNIKENIRRSNIYFQKNYKIFNEYMRFVFKTTLTSNEVNANTDLQIPNLEYNIVETFISRLCSEFSKMDAGFTVRGREGVVLLNPDIIDFVESHLRAAFDASSTGELSYHFYRNMLAGGYDVAKIYTDYASEKSFEQKIFIEPVFDPTLTGFDPMARKSHKGDGRYAYELFPKSASEAEEMFGKDILDGMKFARSTTIGGFNWSYKNQDEDIILIAEYYKKRTKKTKIIKLTNQHSVTEKEYEMFLKKWEESGYVEQAPQPMKSRIADVITIDKYTLTGSKIVDHVETNFSMLPLVFFDGNSAIIRDEMGSPAEQIVRPYIKNARDAQRMKNFAGQRLCNEIENMPQHKFMAPIEGIPANADYQDAYTDMQHATTILYNQYKDGDVNQPLNPPTAVPRAPIPAELLGVFKMADDLVQVTLGSYDAAIGVNDNELSGVAMMQGAMHSNAAAMPYTTGFIRGWARCAEIYLDLLPKYYVTPRTVPIVLPNGKREFQQINSPGAPKFDYDISALDVTVEPGVNYEVQKQIALKTLIALMHESESFAAFMNQNGLEVLLENIDIRGVDQLRVAVQKWMEEQKAEAEQAKQKNANAMTPEQIAVEKLKTDAAKVQATMQGNQLKAQTDMAATQSRAEIENRANDIKFLEVMSSIQGADMDRDIEREKVDAENSRTALDAMHKMGEQVARETANESTAGE